MIKKLFYKWRRSRIIKPMLGDIFNKSPINLVLIELIEVESFLECAYHNSQRKWVGKYILFWIMQDHLEDETLHFLTRSEYRNFLMTEIKKPATYRKHLDAYKNLFPLPMQF